jgi:long-chain acyl-CoA synthetase
MTVVMNVVEDIDTLADLPRFHVQHRPKHIAFHFEDRVTTYQEFDRLVNRVANALLAEGTKAGSRVGFLDKNSDLFYQLVFGAAKAGSRRPRSHTS